MRTAPAKNRKIAMADGLRFASTSSLCGAHILGLFRAAGLVAVIAFLKVALAVQALAVDRQAAYALLKQAEVSFKQNNLQAAVQELSRAIQLDPTFARAYAWRGTAYIRMGDFSRALADFNLMVQNDPDNPENYQTRGDAFMAMGRPDEALKDYKKMYEVEPWNAKGHSLAGEIYRARGDLDSALAEFDKGLEVRPDDAVLYMRRGRLFLQEGLTREAEMEFRRGYQLFPKLRESSVAADIEKARREPRMGSSKKVVVGSPSEALEAGIRLQLEKKHRSAISYLDAAIAADPRDAEAYRYRGRAYSDLWQIERAIEDLNQALQLNPGDAEAFRLRGLAWYTLGQGQNATRDLDAAISLAPNRAVCYMNRAKIYQRYLPNRPSLALADVYRAVQVEPDNPYALHFRGLVRLEQRDANFHITDPGGLDDLNKAIALKPDFAEAYCNRGFAEFLFKDAVNGRKDLGRCFELKPRLRTYYLREINTATTKWDVWAEGFKLYMATSAGPGCGGTSTREEDLGDSIRITKITRLCTPEQIRAYQMKLARLAEDQAAVSNPGPCEGKHAGAFNACLAGDYAASERFETGSATAQDKARYGKY